MEQHVGRAEILEFIQRLSHALIDIQDHLSVSFEIGEQTTVFKISVHKDDIGKVLGKRGRNIEAIRVMVNALSTKHQLRAVVLVEE